MITAASSRPRSARDRRSLPRRAFLEKAASITALGFAAPHLASAADPVPSASRRPNSRIHLGIIGCGHMGRVNLSNCAAFPDVVVTAACDADENRLEPTLEQFKGTCRGYRDYREMLERADLDAVIVATPPHWHALQAIAVCAAGKDLYLQKPPSPGQEREWLDAIRSRKEPSCSVFHHVKVDVPIALGVLAPRLGRSIRFDPRTESIVGDPEAARRAVPEYRAPWKFPVEYLA